MARLWQSGFELNSTTAGVEWTSVLGSPTVSSSTVRTGTYAGRVTSPSAAASTAFLYTFAAANGNGPYFFRVYIRFAVFPNANSRIISLLETGGTQPLTVIYNSSTVNLSIEYNDGATTITGNSQSLKLNQWYKLEFKFDKSPASGSQAIAAFLEGTQFGSASNLTITNGVNQIQVGVNNENDSATACDIFFDDIAINDSTGSSQTSYPGSGNIVHLKPSAAGDVNGFNVQVGGTAGSGNNYTRVNENTPDDATTYNGAALLNAEDLFNCDNFTGGAFSSINVVAVGVRMADLVAGDATTGVKLEIEKAGSGTKTQSANLIPNSTSFLTNAAAAPRNYPLVTYTNPDGGEWTQVYLDSMQIGYINDTVGVQTVAISTVWASVDFTPVLYGTTTSTSSTSASTTSTSISSTSSSISSTSSSTSSTSTSISTSSTSLSTSSTSSSISSTSSSVSSTSVSSTSSSTSISSTSSSLSSTSFSSTSVSSTSSSSSISSTSSSISSTSSSISTTSMSTSSTSFSSTSSSSSTSTTTLPPPALNYTYEDKAITRPILDATASGKTADAGSQTNFTFSHTVGTFNNRLLVVGTAIRIVGADATIASITLGAQNFTQLNTVTNSVMRSDIWYLVAPNTGSGTITVNITAGGSNQDVVAGSSSWYNVDQTTPLSGTIIPNGSATPALGKVFADASKIIIDNLSLRNAGGTPALDTAQTSLYGLTTNNGTADLNPYGAGSYRVGTAESLMRWTFASTNWAQVSAAINPAATVGLPPTNTNLVNAFTTTQYGNVSADDGDYFIERGSEFMIREYKNKNPRGNNTDNITFVWKGRSTEAATVSPVFIQIYNVSTATWETLARETRVAADTDFQATVTQTANVANYYDSTNTVTFRSYQQVI